MTKKTLKAMKLPVGHYKPGKRRSLATTLALAFIALAAAACAVFLTVTPLLDKHREADVQKELVDSIRAGDGAVAMNPRLPLESIDDYDGGMDAPDEEAALFASLSVQAPGVGLDAISTGTDLDAEGVTPAPGTIQGIGILSIDKISLLMPVTSGVSSDQLKVSLGHVPQTAPIGSTGNAVIAGHRSYEYGRHLNRLGEVELGDVIRYQDIDGTVIVFVVDEILIVEPGDRAAFEQPDDKARITLYTCTPIRTATHRLLVRTTRLF